MDILKNNNGIHILNLPDEILRHICKQLSMVDVFHSLVDVNQRFDRLVFDPLYIDHVDLTIQRQSNHHCSPEKIRTLEKVCSNVFPRINAKVAKLTLEPVSASHVLNGRGYSNLHCLSFVHFQPKTLSHYLTDQTLLQLFAHQITRLTVEMHVEKDDKTKNDEAKLFGDLLLISPYLKDFTYLLKCSGKFFTIGSTNISDRLSSSLTKLTINVNTFDDCLYLLNGRLPSLSTFIVRIYDIGRSSTISANANKIVGLRCLSFTVDCYTFEYNTRVVPLLRRMSSLEELTLLLSIARVTGAYVDGDQLYDEVIAYMPRLRHLIFSLHTQVLTNDFCRRSIDLPSTDQLRCSFLRRGMQAIDVYSDTTLIDGRANCHVYSSPYSFKEFFFLNNSFPGGQFTRVRFLSMNDVLPFEHPLFETISRDVPFLEQLSILNNKPQRNRRAHYSTPMTFAHLSSLNVNCAHDDYVLQFLSVERTRLPRLNTLVVDYQSLTRVTNHFTNESTRSNCATITSLVTHEALVPSQTFRFYFPVL